MIAHNGLSVGRSHNCDRIQVAAYHLRKRANRQLASAAQRGQDGALAIHRRFGFAVIQRGTDFARLTGFECFDCEGSLPWRATDLIGSKLFGDLALQAQAAQPG
jgi:hypothetical protein